MRLNLRRKRLLFVALTTFLVPPTAAAETALDWIIGHWCGRAGADSIEEYWLPPQGDMYLGVGRTIREDRTVGFEYFRVVKTEAGLTFIAQPGGRTATEFTMVDSGEQWIRFENREHDFPNVIEYRRIEGTLFAEVRGLKTDQPVLKFSYTQCEAGE